MLALDQLVRSGKALYVGISSYNSQRTKEAYAILKSLGTPFIIHQPSYSMLNRWVETDGLLDTLDEIGIGSIVFSPLAQGMLTDKYLQHIPENSRASQSKSLQTKFLNEENQKNIQALHAIAQRRGQSLAQMAIAWVLRKKQVTSALIGASRPQQVVDCVGALKNLSFSPEEIHEIDLYAKDGHINIWAKSAEID
jgi:L-glyceraldehyde 3-phosphate reductase